MPKETCKKIEGKYREMIGDYDRFRDHFKAGKTVVNERKELMAEGVACLATLESVRSLLPGYYERLIFEFGKTQHKTLLLELEKGLAEKFFQQLLDQGRVSFSENPLMTRYPADVVKLIKTFAPADVLMKTRTYESKFSAWPYFFVKGDLKVNGTVSSTHSPYIDGDGGAVLHLSMPLAEDAGLGAEIFANIEIVAPFDDIEKTHAIVSLSVSNTRPEVADPNYGCPDCNGFGCWSCNFSGGY
jgi:hypothetical protein